MALAVAVADLARFTVDAAGLEVAGHLEGRDDELVVGVLVQPVERQVGRFREDPVGPIPLPGL
jgi:hypothetical protein